MPDGGAFKVDEAALEKFATELAALGRDAAVASDYIDRHLTISGRQAAMFWTVNDAIAGMRDSVTTSLARLEEIMSKSGAELDRTAVRYRSTDGSAAARLDSTYPG